MSLPDGFTDIPPGKIAAIATIMERRTRPAEPPKPTPAGADWRFDRLVAPRLDWYRSLLRSVGRNHLWYQRLLLSDGEIAVKIESPATVIHVLSIDHQIVGFAELDFSGREGCELVYFGVTDDWIGRGAAGFMMERVLAFAFSQSVESLWLHTNTIDHPRAMAFYRRFGFVPIRQMLELADDPRLTGIYDEKAAPQVPIFSRARD